MKICPGKKYIFSFMVTTLTGWHVMAQQVVTSNESAYHNAIAKAAFRKIKKDHYAPKPLDDAYSAVVWKDFFQTLDPNSHLFLQGDISQLAGYKNQIDDELNAGNTTFFDAAYSVYYKRAKEAEALCMKILSKPLDLQKKDSVVVWRKNLPFPANEAEREALWRKELKYYTLRNYVELEKNAGTGKNKNGVDATLEAKAREKVRKWYAGLFRKATGKDGMSERFSQYLSLAVAEIDPHTAYTAPTDLAFNDMLTKRFCGIGVELSTKDSDYYIKRLMPGGTAYKSGLVKENDVVVAIADSKGNMQEVSGWESTQVSGLIRGEKGTAVTMKLQQPGEKERTVTVKREEIIDMENRAKSALIEKDGKTFGYIYLPLFYVDASGMSMTGCSADVYREVVKLQENNVDGIIMDLRGNGGGGLDEVVKMSGFFMPQGPVTMLRSKDSVNSYISPAGLSFYDGPLTVLVDENSASASEIFTAAVQDRGRAVIVGTSSTFGKGTAQSMLAIGKMGDQTKGIPDTSYGNIRLTMQKFYRITGASTQLRGVTPDIVLQDRMSLLSVMEKDYSSALPYDSIAAAPFERLPFTFNYARVVAQAKERVRKEAVLGEIATNMRRLKALQAKPVMLDIAGYHEYNQQVTQLENEIKQLKELREGHYLQVLPAVFQSINPAFVKTDPVEEARRKEWLQQLSKDIYLQQTVTVLEDMLANPQ